MTYSTTQNPPRPAVSVDKVRAYLPFHHSQSIGGPLREVRRGRRLPDLFWISLPNGKVGIRSDKLGLLVDFNPREIEWGQNIYNFDDPLLPPLLKVLGEIVPRSFGKLQTSRLNSVRVRSGVIPLSALTLSADFAFPMGTNHTFRTLRAMWGLPRNKRMNDRFASTIYLKHRHWDLVIYDKEAEVESQHPDWPPSVREMAKNVLRVEVLLRRQELRRLGRRLARYYRETIEQDLSIAYPWDASLYDRVFDLYVSRYVRHGNREPTDPRVVPLYSLFASRGAEPAFKRSGTYAAACVEH
jgi:hypothetical protein